MKTSDLARHIFIIKEELIKLDELLPTELRATIHTIQDRLSYIKGYIHAINHDKCDCYQ